MPSGAIDVTDNHRPPPAPRLLGNGLTHDESCGATKRSGPGRTPSSTAPGRRPCGPAGSRESTVLRPGAPFFCSDAEPKSQIAAGHQRTANGPRQNFSNILPIDRFDSTFCRWRSRLRDVTMVCDVANTVRVPAGSLASLVRSGGSVTVSALTGRRCTCHVALRIRRCCTFFVQSHLAWPPGEQI